MKAAASDIEGEMKEKEITVGKAAKYCEIDGNKSKDLAKDLGEFDKFLKTATSGKDVVKYAEQFAGGIEAYAEFTDETSDEEIDNAKKAIAKAASELADANMKRFEIDRKVADKRYGENTETKRSAGILGNKAFFAPELSEEVAFGNFATITLSMAAELADVDGNAEASKDAKVGAMDAKEIAATCDQVIAICDTVMSFKEEEKSVQAIEKAAAAAGDAVSKKAKDMGAPLMARAGIKLAVRSLRKVVTGYNKPVTQLSQHAIAVANASLDLAIRSKGNIGKKKEEDK